MTKPGPKGKDAVIRDGFNRQKKTPGARRLTSVERHLEKIRRETEEFQAKKKLDDKIANVKIKIQKLVDELSALNAAAGYEDEETPTGASASAMLEQMWKVYRSVGGLKKLQESMKDPKEFRAMAKEMMKIEATVSRNKQAGGGDGSTVFVILKGLDTGVDITGEAIDATVMRKVSQAINPNAPRQKVEDTKSLAAPEQLIGSRLKSVEEYAEEDDAPKLDRGSEASPTSGSENG